MSLNVVVIVSFLLGVVMGSLFTLLRSSGTIHIDCSNPDKDRYLFEFDKLDGLSKKHRVILKIDNKADLSQK